MPAWVIPAGRPTIVASWLPGYLPEPAGVPLGGPEAGLSSSSSPLPFLRLTKSTTNTPTPASTSRPARTRMIQENALGPLLLAAFCVAAVLAPAVAASVGAALSKDGCG